MRSISTYFMNQYLRFLPWIATMLVVRGAYLTPVVVVEASPTTLNHGSQNQQFHAISFPRTQPQQRIQNQPVLFHITKCI
jgi:hypothetical protein